MKFHSKTAIIVLVFVAAVVAALWVAKPPAEKSISKTFPSPLVEDSFQTENEIVTEERAPAGSSIRDSKVTLQGCYFPPNTSPLIEEYLLSGGQFNAKNRVLLQKLAAATSDARVEIAAALELAELEWRHGYFVGAVKTLERAWTTGQPLSDLEGKQTAEKALALYLQKLARLGEREKLRELVSSLADRKLGGAASEALIQAKSALWFHENQAEQNVFCGFTAANTVCVPQGYRAIHPDVHDPEEGKEFIANGLSLFELRAHSLEGDGDLQIYRRVDPQASIPVPSIVHWRFDHYSAVTEEKEGRLRVKDVHLRVDTMMDPEAFEEQFSGYLLAFSKVEIPDGFELVGDEEAKTVFGSHCVHGREAEGDEQNPCNKNQDQGQPMADYTFRLLNPGLEIFDTPISYAPPVGPPVAFRLEYDQRSSVIEDAPPQGNFGPRWTHRYSSYLELTGTPIGEVPATSANIIWGNGQFYTYNFETGSGRFLSRYIERPRLAWSPTESEFTFSNPDGSKFVYGHPNSPAPTRYFLTKIVDAQGNAVSLGYDGNNRLISITDAIGQQTTLSYTPGAGAAVPGDSTKIRSITDPFGRRSTFSYTSVGQLLSITDPVGIVSQFSYAADTDYVAELTTPYGTTTFKWGDLPGINEEPGRFIEATNPQGDRERAEANDYSGYPADGVSPLPAPTTISVNDESIGFMPKVTNLGYRNTFYWDRKQMREAPGDFSKATLYNWTANDDTITSVLASFKAPLENRVWFNYPGQTSAEGGGTSAMPSKTVKAVEDKDGVLQWSMGRASYHPVTGKITGTIDPLGRELVFEYNDDSSQTGAVEGIDLTAIKVRTAVGFETLAAFSGYSDHLPTAATNAAGETTTFAYNARGQLTSTTDPERDTTAYSYDTNGYLVSINGPLAGAADTITFTYDSAGRTQTITDFDGYTVTYSYDDIDRLTRVDYPDGTYEENTYENLDLVSSRDRLGRVTTFSYDEIRQLVGVTDPENRTVGYEWCKCGDLRTLIDPMGRATRWHRDVQGRVDYKEYVDGSRIRFAYEPGSGRLSQRIDEKGQITRFRYNIDGTLHAKLFPNAEIATPTVTFGYDPFFKRVTSMTDGLGETTTSYHPVGSLGANEVATIDGPWSNDEIAYAYDALGRVTSRAINGISQSPSYDAASRLISLTNSLGTFTYTYEGATSRLSQVSHGGGVKAQFNYYGNSQDNRLQSITNRTPSNSIVSKFSYNYDAIGRITQWTQQAGASSATADVWALGYDGADQLTSASITTGGTPTKGYNWIYDPAANRLTETEDGATQDFRYNALNQLDSTSLNLPETSYEWDAEDRLVAINQGTGRSEFEYDGLGRRVRIRELSNGVEISNRTLLWCGLEICEERDGSGEAVQRRYLAQGMQDLTGSSTQAYLYTFDHLGSIRELLSPTGGLQERLSYDAWGNVEFSNAQPISHFSYTGHFTHQPSGLHLAPYRAYDPRAARWISRDPIGEGGGINLYAYAWNTPCQLVDPTGEHPLIIAWMIFEVATSAYDIYDAASTFLDPCASYLDKVISATGLLVGAIAPGGGYGAAARNAPKVKYIGRLDDLKGIPRNQTLLDDLPDLGSPRANYYQNSSILRKAVRDGYEIRDASAFRLNSELASTLLRPDRTVGQTFLGAERLILGNKGLRLSPSGSYLSK
ncbi:RHS repeat-associated protein [Haloferula luteola]|uniref:RHS repeat-associated protein n=1 Tax=Haloferula luteola TaxID=595692 RepID=A0A840V4N4_9BACT|nr:RHS repeat-associated core domain-containing protein [Haloferula luteola]MBB5352942.1 RHS repeat-associated protein [Haloferula luteola]